MFRTLFAKLAAALLPLFLLFGVFHVVSTLVTTRLYRQEVDQRLNRTLAAHLASEEILMTNGRINQKALERVFHMLMVINPSIEIYLLDPSGAILAYSAPPGTVKRSRVDLEPIRRLLRSGERLPVLGDDPRDARRQKVFSVSELPLTRTSGPAAPQGFLYVILGSEQYESAAALLRDSYVLNQSAIAGIAAVLLTTVAGLFLFRMLTRRLRSLTAAVDRFTKSGFSEISIALPAHAPEDDIDQLAASFRLMAGRIEEQVRGLRKTDALRRELVANVSHDLRTPLAALRGYLDTLLLKENTLSAVEKRDYLETAARHSENLGKLVSELFELATLDSRQAPPELEPFSLPELVSDVAQKFRLAAENKGVSLTAAPPLYDLPFARGDIGLVERVLDNLLDNALRYTPAGGEVTVSVRPESYGTLSITVADSGRGIAAGDLPHVFERFYRASPRESGSGAGLGLAIAHRIVELHGGRIDVESVSGGGSRFHFRLPSVPEPKRQPARDGNVTSE